MCSGTADYLLRDSGSVGARAPGNDSSNKALRTSHSVTLVVGEGTQGPHCAQGDGPKDPGVAAPLAWSTDGEGKIVTCSAGLRKPAGLWTDAKHRVFLFHGDESLEHVHSEPEGLRRFCDIGPASAIIWQISKMTNVFLPLCTVGVTALSRFFGASSSWSVLESQTEFPLGRHVRNFAALCAYLTIDKSRFVPFMVHGGLVRVPVFERGTTLADTSCISPSPFTNREPTGLMIIVIVTSWKSPHSADCYPNRSRTPVLCSALAKAIFPTSLGTLPSEMSRGAVLTVSLGSDVVAGVAAVTMSQTVTFRVRNHSED